MNDPIDMTARLRALEQENADLRARLNAGPQASGRGLDPVDLRARLHDIRQPVQAARLFHGLLLRRLTEGEDAERLGRLGQALDAIETHLASLQELARSGGSKG